MASEIGLPNSWLNEQASIYIPQRPDPGMRTVFDHPNLKVTAASPRMVMAMKTRAARPRDIADLRTLADLLDVDDIDGVIAVHDEVFPTDPLPARTEARLRTYWE